MKLLKVVPLLMLSLTLLSACGKAKYQKVELSATAVAGQYTRPKIDIVIFQDNSDSSMNGTVQSVLKPRLQSFLTSLDSRWDYHFTVLPLLYKSTMNQKYTAASDCTGVSNCITAAQFNSAPGDSGWLQSTYANGNSDFGFEYIKQNLSDSSMTSSGFLRADAALATVVVTNGNDISAVQYTYNAGGQQVIDQTATNAGLTTYANFLKNFKPSALMSKFFPVFSPNQNSNCYGSLAFAGSSYRYVSDQIGLTNSAWFNFCDSTALNQVLGSITNQLQSLVAAYMFNYVVLTEEPAAGSIKVSKNGVSIPESAVNGWQYVGYLSNQPTSYLPALSNVKSGYMIKLNGTATYSGTDKIDVKYKAK